ncbi:MAG: aldehyde ferredoxin oxidoreductase family protein [Deltaproteobacteria bacterium]|nr:aldehyde ferredoxin oxidoreductase family protein [Deltaproteobacteria bacterium]
MKGFFGRILHIDLGSSSYYVEELADEVYERFLGGKGLATHLLLANLPPKINPFSSENILIFALGPVTDSKIFGSCRYGVFTKSSLTGYYSESYAGGKAAEPMSRTGYDAVILQGAAPSPTLLEISDTGITFHDASDLWGLDTNEAEDSALERVKTPHRKAALVIGPAGERLVRFAVIGNDHGRQAGRTGVGAVMGAKRIKGIVFHGTQNREIAKPDLIDRFAKEIQERGKKDPGALAYKQFGTPQLVAVMNRAKGFPSRYWSQGTLEGWERISADALLKECRVKSKACPRCFMACGELSEVTKGRHKGLRIEGPEYETIYAFGGLCLVTDINEIIYLNNICDRLGMDTITAGNLAAFTIEAARRGKIAEKIDYGDVDAIASLLQQIARREGIGEVLAQGIVHAAKTWSLEDIAIHVKGLEPAGYDPRVLKGMGLAYATSDRGACHLRTTFYKPELAGIINPDQIEGKAELLVEYEDRLVIFDSLIICRFYRDMYPWEKLATIVEGTTGLRLYRVGLRKIASQIMDNTRRFNLREGLTKADDILPIRFHQEPLPETGKVITKEQMEKLLADYYCYRGWDSEGRPST